jgi:D-alanyl-D-alanine carboxypeptidase (penicillin-binding protein 5/6)
VGFGAGVANLTGLPSKRLFASSGARGRPARAYRPLLALVLLVALAGGLAWFQLQRPVPAPAARQTIAAASDLPGPRPNVPWPRTGIAAVGVTGLGLVETSPGERPLPMWSIAKVMTALVVLDDKPLKKDEPGPGITVTAADVQTYQQQKADKQSVVEVRAGETLTEYQALQGLLIPSGNNIADLLARWDAGSLDAFVAKMNARAKTMGLAKTAFADASGASEKTASTPADLTRLALAAVANPVIVEIVAQPQVELPVAGVLYNVDYSLGQGGVAGIKTGSNPGQGAGFMFSAPIKVGAQNLTLVGAVMGVDTLDEAFAASRRLIDFARQAVVIGDAIKDGVKVGEYETRWGQRADLVATQNAPLVEWPGLTVKRTLETRPLPAPVAARTAVGVLVLTLGDQEVRVDVATGSALGPPTTAWRLTRLG